MSDIILFRSKVAQFSLDPAAAELTRDGEPIHLPRKQLALLLYLAQRPRKLVTKEALVTHVWDGAAVGETTLSKAVTDVRKALGDSSENPQIIETVSGSGYRFIATNGDQTNGRPPKKVATEEQRPTDPEVHVAKLPTVNPLLIGREDELKQLDEAWTDPNIRLVSIVAYGGVGKTSLALNWWHTRSRQGAPQNIHVDAQRVLGWSFYSQGAAEDRQASADPFLDHALRQWFGVENPPQDSWQRGEKLAELLRKERTLLILDGLEPIQFPPGPQHGRLKDPGMVALLKELAANSPGLCVCTSRLPLTDLEDHGNAGVLTIDLDNLTPTSGAEYLKQLGVVGQAVGLSDELAEASKEFGNHALALTFSEHSWSSAATATSAGGTPSRASSATPRKAVTPAASTGSTRCYSRTSPS
jgi:DNA-binding winged helix-turn-helix (wHTH) protein